jgi:outer membrane protein assembly factor BamB
VDNVPALNSDASAVYFVATDPDTLNNDAMLYAVNTSDGSFRWRYPLAAENNEITSSPTVDTQGTANPNDDVIYVGDDNNFVYAFRPAARIVDPTPVFPFPLGAGEWQFLTGGEIESSAAVDPDDGTIYIGSDDSYVWAINPNGTKKWRFRTNGNVESSPIIDVDGTVYIGSLDGNVYALKTDARLADLTEDTLDPLAGEWAFLTGGPVPSSPALGQAGFIHIGSDDANLYTISQFADPRNFKDENKTEGKLLTSEDLDSSVLVNSTTDWLNGAGSRGSWAVRLEVNRALLPNVDGRFDYDLRLWIRQCPDPTDIPCDDILGTFYQDTRVEYDYNAVEDLPMRQSFSLSGAEQDAFERFFFGFTGAAGAQALDVTISQFQLSFTRPGDPVVDCDKLNWPVEAPVPDCLLID